MLPFFLNSRRIWSRRSFDFISVPLGRAHLSDSTVDCYPGKRKAGSVQQPPAEVRRRKKAVAVTPVGYACFGYKQSFDRLLLSILITSCLTNNHSCSNLHVESQRIAVFLDAATTTWGIPKSAPKSVSEAQMKQVCLSTPRIASWFFLLLSLLFFVFSFPP